MIYQKYTHKKLHFQQPAPDSAAPWTALKVLTFSEKPSGLAAKVQKNIEQRTELLKQLPTNTTVVASTLSTKMFFCSSGWYYQHLSTSTVLWFWNYKYLIQSQTSLHVTQQKGRTCSDKSQNGSKPHKITTTGRENDQPFSSWLMCSQFQSKSIVSSLCLKTPAAWPGYPNFANPWNLLKRSGLNWNYREEWNSHRFASWVHVCRRTPTGAGTIQN